MPLLSPKSLPKNKAFTLVELMVVILIIGILVTIMAGAVVKWMAWQRDPTNPNSSVSLTINTIKQAVTRITQDIQQKSKQDYQALSTADKGLFQALATDLNMKNVSTQNFLVLTEMEPTNRSVIAYANTRILRAFPIDAAKIVLFQNTTPITVVNNDISSARSNPFFQFDFNTPIPTLTSNATLVNGATLSSGTTLRDVTECPSYRPIAYPVTNSFYYSNFFLSLDALTRKNTTAIENSIYKAHLAANSLVASTPSRNSSACLLMALESHPKGLKVEDLGSGSISKDSTGARIIQPGGAVIYHKIHYVDAADYAADKSFKIGSLRVDIAYDTE
jgi:prepilin-type N-terminal cleavage/methylation domain-containing protein